MDAFKKWFYNVLHCAAITNEYITTFSLSLSISYSLSLYRSVSLSSPIAVHPVIQVPNQLVGAPLGTDVQIECHVEASPKSINYWIKDTGEYIYIYIHTYICVCDSCLHMCPYVRLSLHVLLLITFWSTFTFYRQSVAYAHILL